METFINNLNQHPAFVSAVAATILAIIALTSFLVTRQYYLKTIDSKLNDRLLELSKLMMQYPEVARDFLIKSNVQEAYFKAIPCNDSKESDYQLRGYTYFRLNLYEEAFMATQGLFDRHTRRGQEWRNYIKEHMRHPLVRELFDKTPHQFDQRFVLFVQENN